MLLEKAFAKYQKSYANIEGGLMLHALIVFTGCNGNHFDKGNDGWSRWNLSVTPSDNKNGKDKAALKSAGGIY